MAATSSWESPNRHATCYHGARLADGSVTIIAHDAQSGWRAPLVHFVRFHEGPLNWGPHGGKAATDLVRSLLVDALGPHALCPACDGRQRVVWTGPDTDDDPVPYDPDEHAACTAERITPCICEDGLRPLPYADLEAQWAAGLPDHWSISRDAILHWLLARYQVGDVPAWLLAACGVDDVPLPEPTEPS